MWKLEAKDSFEEQSHQKFLPSVPEEPLYNEEEPALDSSGTNLQLLSVHKYHTWITSIYSHRITLEAIDPIDHSKCEFETQVMHAVENRGCLSAITTLCRLKPQTPAEEEDEDEDGCFITWHKEAVDDFFRGDMPDWITEDALTQVISCNTMEKENEWLHLYAELALFSKWQSNLEEMASAKPFEMRKIVVRTRGDVEPKKKAKAENAIFCISFKTRCGRDCNGIIRKTTDRMPGHFSFEVKCLM